MYKKNKDEPPKFAPSMPQTFLVLRCYSCGVFQAQTRLGDLDPTSLKSLVAHFCTCFHASFLYTPHPCSAALSFRLSLPSLIPARTRTFPCASPARSALADRAAGTPLHTHRLLHHSLSPGGTTDQAAALHVRPLRRAAGMSSHS